MEKLTKWVYFSFLAGGVVLSCQFLLMSASASAEGNEVSSGRHCAVFTDDRIDERIDTAVCRDFRGQKQNSQILDYCLQRNDACSLYSCRLHFPTILGCEGAE
jgi:hypothetical protein